MAKRIWDQFRRHWPGTAAAVAVAVIGFVIKGLMPQPGIGIALGGNLSDVQSRQIDLLIGHAHLLISWSIGLLAAIAYFLKEQVETKPRLPLSERAALSLAAVFLVMGVVLGNMIQLNTITLLSVDQFSTGSRLIAPYASLQYFSLGLALACIVYFIVNRLFPGANHALD